jgi:hypothetical protein
MACRYRMEYWDIRAEVTLQAHAEFLENSLYPDDLFFCDVL